MGAPLLHVFPRRAEAMLNTGLRLTESKRYGFIERCLLAALVWRLARGREIGRLLEHHKRFWASDAASQYHDDYSAYSETTFRKAYDRAGRHVHDLLSAHPDIRHLYEIGTGSGRVLTLLKERFPELESFTGIDLSESTIAATRTAHDGDGLGFVAADALSWIPRNAKSGALILSLGGVFEYIAPREASAFFKALAQEFAPVGVFMLEPIAWKHNLGTERRAIIYGGEYSISHNYPHMLQNAGFDVHCVEDVQDHDDYRLVAIVASSNGDARTV